MEPLGRVTDAGQGYAAYSSRTAPAGAEPAQAVDPAADAQGGGLSGVPQDHGRVPSAREAKRQDGKKPGRFDRNDCQTCKNRKYQDGSNDPGVSFKTPTQIDPGAAASAVKSHEMEHVFRERGKAQREGREVVYQSVTLHTGVCPECGRVYISGGTTRTATRNAKDEVNEVLQSQREESGGESAEQ